MLSSNRATEDYSNMPTMKTLRQPKRLKTRTNDRRRCKRGWGRVSRCRGKTRGQGVDNRVSEQASAAVGATVDIQVGSPHAKVQRGMRKWHASRRRMEGL